MFLKKAIIDLCFLSIFFFISCTVPKHKQTNHIPAVIELDLNRYMGTWYEIARLPNSFEKDLDNVTATYTLLDNGKVEVLNQGYKNGKQKTAKGKAWLPDKSKPGELKVAFFLFFGAPYKVIELEKENYQYSLVTSSSKDYLWILSRKPELKKEILDKLLENAKGYGFDIDRLIMVSQKGNN